MNEKAKTCLCLLVICLALAIVPQMLNIRVSAASLFTLMGCGGATISFFAVLLNL